jgi:hypothetical protein
MMGVGNGRRRRGEKEGNRKTDVALSKCEQNSVVGNVNFFTMAQRVHLPFSSF